MELMALCKPIKKPPRSDERDGELFCGTQEGIYGIRGLVASGNLEIKTKSYIKTIKCWPSSNAGWRLYPTQDASGSWIASGNFSSGVLNTLDFTNYNGKCFWTSGVILWELEMETK